MSKSTLLFDVRCSVFDVRCLLDIFPLIVGRCRLLSSTFNIRRSLSASSLGVERWALDVERFPLCYLTFDVRCSMFDVRCSMFDVRCSPHIS